MSAVYVRCQHVFPISNPGLNPQPQPTTRRRRRQPISVLPWFLIAGLLCLLLAGGILLKKVYQEKAIEPQVSWDNFHRLHLGMKEREAFHILGIPKRTDNSVAPQVDVHAAHRYTVDERQFEGRCFWEEGEDVIWVAFLQGVVKDYGCTIDGKQLGVEVTEPLVKERQIKDD